MTDKEFDVLLELSGLTVDEGEREVMMSDVESILGYVSQLPEEKGERKKGKGASSMNHEPRTPFELRPDELTAADAKEVEAIRRAFPLITEDKLLEVQDVFGSKDL